MTTREQTAILLYLIVLGCFITAFDPANKPTSRYHQYGYVPEDSTTDVMFGLRGRVE